MDGKFGMFLEIGVTTNSMLAQATNKINQNVTTPFATACDL